VALLAQFIYHEIVKVPDFCDTDGVSSKDCIPCPSSGVCYSGKLHCNDGYVQSGLVCIEDGEVNKLANSIADSAYYLLREAKGKFECHEAPSKYFICQRMR